LIVFQSIVVPCAGPINAGPGRAVFRARGAASGVSILPGFTQCGGGKRRLAPLLNVRSIK
jgi:hypothetical protein